MQIGGGILLLLGYKVRWGSFLLILFIIPASLIFHDFWNLEGSERYIEKVMFMKDWGILGGLLQVFAFGGGAYSLDFRKKKKSRFLF